MQFHHRILHFFNDVFGARICARGCLAGTAGYAAGCGRHLVECLSYAFGIRVGIKSQAPHDSGNDVEGIPAAPM